MIYTSYFARWRGRWSDERLLAISATVPPGFPLRSRLPIFAPPDALLASYKAGMDWERYSDAYERVLWRWEVATWALALDRRILLCWEKSRDHCHRRLVAEWLECETGVAVPEWTEEADA